MDNKRFINVGLLAWLIIVFGPTGCVLQTTMETAPASGLIQQQVSESDTPTTGNLAATHQPQTTQSDTPTIQTLTATIQPRTIVNETPTLQYLIADWKTYRNMGFGFEFQYPADLHYLSSGLNEVQKALERGEAISGTAAPSLDTITFFTSSNHAQFNIVIFPVREDEVSVDGFNEYLSIGSDCDTRWIDSVVEQPTLVDKNGIPVLDVQVHHDPVMSPLGYSGCYFLKNSTGNLIAFNISGFEQKSDMVSVYGLVGDGILSTFRLIK